MSPIFGPSPERWKIRKKELIQTLRDGGYTSFAQSFYSQLKFKGLQQQKSFAEKAFYEGVHVLDHPGHEQDEVSKHKQRQTKQTRQIKVKQRRQSSTSSRSGGVKTRSGRSNRIAKLDSAEEEEGGEREAAQKQREREAATEDADVLAGSLKNHAISFTASPGGDGVARDLPSAPPVSMDHTLSLRRAYDPKNFTTPKSIWVGRPLRTMFKIDIFKILTTRRIFYPPPGRPNEP